MGNQAGLLGNRETTLRGNDASNRTELRNERTFQNDQARQAQQDRISQAQFAQWLESQTAGNAGTYAGTGYGNTPSSSPSSGVELPRRTFSPTGRSASRTGTCTSVMPLGSRKATAVTLFSRRS